MAIKKEDSIIQNIGFNEANQINLSDGNFNQLQESLSLLQNHDFGWKSDFKDEIGLNVGGLVYNILRDNPQYEDPDSSYDPFSEENREGFEAYDLEMIDVQNELQHEAVKHRIRELERSRTRLGNSARHWTPMLASLMTDPISYSPVPFAKGLTIGGRLLRGALIGGGVVATTEPLRLSLDPTGTKAESVMIISSAALIGGLLSGGFGARVSTKMFGKTSPTTGKAYEFVKDSKNAAKQAKKDLGEKYFQAWEYYEGKGKDFSDIFEKKGIPYDGKRISYTKDGTTVYKSVGNNAKGEVKYGNKIIYNVNNDLLYEIVLIDKPGGIVINKNKTNELTRLYYRDTEVDGTFISFEKFEKDFKIASKSNKTITKKKLQSTYNELYPKGKSPTTKIEYNSRAIQELYDSGDYLKSPVKGADDLPGFIMQDYPSNVSQPIFNSSDDLTSFLIKKQLLKEVYYPRNATKANAFQVDDLKKLNDIEYENKINKLAIEQLLVESTVNREVDGAALLTWFKKSTTQEGFAVHAFKDNIKGAMDYERFFGNASTGVRANRSGVPTQQSAVQNYYINYAAKTKKLQKELNADYNIYRGGVSNAKEKGLLGADVQTYLTDVKNFGSRLPNKIMKKQNETTRDEFHEMVGKYIIDPESMPDVHPSIAQASIRARKHFGDMHRESEKLGMYQSQDTIKQKLVKSLEIQEQAFDAISLLEKETVKNGKLTKKNKLKMELIQDVLFTEMQLYGDIENIGLLLAKEKNTEVAAYVRDPNFFPRNYDLKKIDADEPRFRKILTDHFYAEKIKSEANQFNYINQKSGDSLDPLDIEINIQGKKIKRADKKAARGLDIKDIEARVEDSLNNIRYGQIGFLDGEDVLGLGRRLKEGDPLAKSKKYFYTSKQLRQAFKVEKENRASLIDNGMIQATESDISPGMSLTSGARSLIRRKVDIPNVLIQDFLELNVLKGVLNYTHNLGKQIELNKVFGDNNMHSWVQKEKIRMVLEYVNNEKDAIKLQKYIGAFVNTKDSFLGVMNTTDPFSLSRKVTSVGLNLSSLAYMGSVVFNAATEFGRPMMVHGIRKVFGQGLYNMVANRQTLWREAQAQAPWVFQAIDTVTENYKGRYMESLQAAPGNSKTIGGKAIDSVARAFQWAQKPFYNLNLLTPITQILKDFTTVLSIHRFIEDSLIITRGVGQPHPTKARMIKKKEFVKAEYILNTYGINANKARLISSMPFTLGTKDNPGGNLILSNMQDWQYVKNGNVAIQSFKAAVESDVNRTIVTADVTDKPTMMSGVMEFSNPAIKKFLLNNRVAKLALNVNETTTGVRVTNNFAVLAYSFLTWPLAANNKLLISAVQGRDTNPILGATAILAMAYAAGYARNPYGWDSMDFDEKIYETVVRSGITGLYGDFDRTLDVTTRTLFGDDSGISIRSAFDMDPSFGEEVEGGAVGAYNLGRGIAGPAVDMVATLADIFLFDSLTDENAKKSVRRLIPLSNLWAFKLGAFHYVDEAYDWTAEKLVEGF